MMERKNIIYILKPLQASIEMKSSEPHQLLHYCFAMMHRNIRNGAAKFGTIAFL